ncbi:MAG TPA: 16S rRNA (adenine(1518)-N(6)/adenine(1519)-N(6))-dimethyltransferase RsmA [Candidatus Babeliales bacterium]|nr:16S rRNA (adenine(1518)-N(6)/adenine(1519)-N(6))-dimethyltransferase RsmA [Candidatus Babeliales bacterium]
MHFAHGIQIKKQYGQHFLRWQVVIDHMIERVSLDKNSSVFEIGCGDGFLTRSILKQPIKQLWVFEIDPQWADFVRKSMPNKRMTIYEQNILDLDWSIFEPDQPWTLLANLPYQITFPILHMLQKNRHLLHEGVIMVQEEVAEKLLKSHGRGYGYPSLFFQYYFNWEKLDKVPPQAFEPPPKVHSRLLYFKPKENVAPIPDEPAFWDFIKMCFRQPRRTLRNNMQQTHFDISIISEELLALRAQQMNIDDFLTLWKKLNS